MEFTEKQSIESGVQVETTESRRPPMSSSGAVAAGPGVMSMTIESGLGVKVAAQESGGAGGGGVVLGNGSGGDLMIGTAGSKKKRGRPRKYDSEGNLRIPYIATGGTGSPPPGFTLTSPNSSSSYSHSQQYWPSSKRGRGRPSGSGNWQILASLGELFSSTAGGDFTPHVVNVYAGEDVAGKILTFSQKGSRGMCVLSANGTISNVTIRQPGSSGGLLTYEGRFEILSLTGSFTISENGGIRSRTGGLSVSLAGPDGRVIGGGVAGLLLAASPIQIVVGSFVPNGYKTIKKRHNPEPRMGTITHSAPDVGTVANPVSQAAPESRIFSTPSSHLPVEANGEADNSTSTRENANSTSSDVADYNISVPTSDLRETPDINVSVSFEQQ